MSRGTTWHWKHIGRKTGFIKGGVVMAYYVVFSYKGKPICGTWVRAESKEEAMVNGEFKLMCRYPNVPYDSTQVTCTK